MRRVYTSLTESYRAIGWLCRRKQYIAGYYALIVQSIRMETNTIVGSGYLMSVFAIVSLLWHQHGKGVHLCQIISLRL